MCGVAGFIGKSKDLSKTKALVTDLFDKTQVRGTDASGYYCITENNNIFYKKQPGPSNLLIDTDDYQSIWESDVVSGIFHCRAASIGVGEPANNINNHPFVSSDRKKAVIHNGLISASEYKTLSENYTLESKCDSEVILRILEEQKDEIVNFKRFFKSTKESFFAVVYSCLDGNQKKLFLTRNRHRPLFFIDLVDEIGQIFFFSTLEILTHSIWNLRMRGIIFNNMSRIYSLKPYELIKFSFDSEKGLSTKWYFAKEEMPPQNKGVLENKLEELLRLFKRTRNNLTQKEISGIFSQEAKLSISVRLDEIKEKLNSISLE